jgi:hypothetical protein
MLFPVTTLAVFGAIVLAGSTRDGDAMSLQKLVVRSLFCNHHESTCDFIMEAEITRENAEVIHLLLKDAGASCVQRYNNTKEGPDRLAQLLEPRLLEDERYQETLYSPTKLLIHPDLAKAFFGPGEDKGSRGKEEKEKEKDCDGEPLKLVEHGGDKVEVESISDLPGIMSGLKISEQLAKETKSIQYGGNFFETRRLSELLVELYKADSELAMRIVEFIIKHQMDYMNSLRWLEFLCIASLGDQLSVVDMLTPHEMSSEILGFISRKKIPNGERLVSRYLDKNLPENELLVRCAIAKMASIPADDKCIDLLRETTNEGLMVILEGREDRSSRTVLAKLSISLRRKSKFGVLLEADFYKLTPYHTRFLAASTELDPIQEAAFKSTVPLHLLPSRYRSLGHRLKRWLTLEGPYEYVKETDIPQEQFDLTKTHFALDTYITTAAARRIRVADYFVEGAKDLLKSPMLMMKMDDFELMLTALGYLLADGRQLDCSNFFMDIGDDSSWNDFARKSNEKIRNSQDESLCENPVGFFILGDRLPGMQQIMSLKEFRSLVDSSYRG